MKRALVTEAGGRATFWDPNGVRYCSPGAARSAHPGFGWSARKVKALIGLSVGDRSVPISREAKTTTIKVSKP